MSDTDDLDDLLADTPSSTDLTIDEDSDVATDSAKASKEMQLDLDELLASAKEGQARAKKHKEDLKRIRSSKRTPLEVQEQKDILARILEWEITRVWKTLAKIERFNIFTCKKCLRQSRVFDGIWLEQSHEKLKAKRLVRLPKLEDLAAYSDMQAFVLDKLELRRVDVSMEIDCCAECSPSTVQYEPAIKF